MATETRVDLYLLRGWINKFSWNSQHQIQLIHLSVIELLHIGVLPDLLPDVFCLMVRIFRLMLVLFFYI